MEMVLHGKQGKTLTVEGDVIKIEKHGFLTGTRSKTLPIRNITSVEVKKPGAFVGFIQFSIAGGKARDSSYTFTGGALDAVQDENSVIFSAKADYELALQIKEYVEAWAAKDAAAVATPASSTSVADEIRKLKQLADEGVITPEEFERKKKQLLGS